MGCCNAGPVSAKTLACDIIDNNEPFLSVDLTGRTNRKAGPWVNYTLNENPKPCICALSCGMDTDPSHYDAQLMLTGMCHIMYRLILSQPIRYIIIDTVINGQAFQENCLV